MGYLRAIRSTTQANIADGSAVIFDSVIDSREASRILLDTTTGQVTLKAGFTYELWAQVSLEHSTAFLVALAWYNVTAAAEEGGTRQKNRSTSAAGNNNSTTISKAIVTPSVDTVYEVRRVTEAGDTDNVDITATFTQLEIVELR